MPATGVLVFPAGETNSIELHNALSTCVNIRLYGASSVDRHGEYVFSNYISGLPNISDSSFIPEFNRIIDENDIDIIFPTHDTVAEFLSVNQEKINAKVIAADAETAKICRDKKKTYELFADADFCPKIYKTPKEFPVFIKPRLGQGAQGAKLVTDETQLPSTMDDYVICEYLPGEEMTVDCLTDQHGTLKAILPRSRKRIFGGVSVAGENEPLTDEISDIAHEINKQLRFLGLWYFQIKKAESGRYKLLEISVRCAGSMCLSRACGVNLPLLSVYAAIGCDIEVATNPYDVGVDRALISRYKLNYNYDHVYIDLDDTIIIKGKVHLPAVWFLYQCKNNGKYVTLITRHDLDHKNTVADVLDKYHLSPSLFEKIISLKTGENKPEKINSKKAIFIDNAYAERKAVQKQHNIPVFDVDMLEVLMDWRM